jgi:hypothetical protein
VRMLWLMLHSSYDILYIHIRPSIPYIVGALSCIWGLLMRVFSGTGNAKYYSRAPRRSARKKGSGYENDHHMFEIFIWLNFMSLKDEYFK